MYCSNCGSKNDINYNYCINCGNDLKSNGVTTQNNNSNGNKETSLVLGIICLVSSFFINILCFIPGIISIIYAKKYKKESGKFGVGFGLSLGGMIFSFIVLLLVIFLFTIIFNVVNNIDTNDFNYDYETKYTYKLPNV